MVESSAEQQAVSSANETPTGESPRVLPTNQLVILRESELETDLTTAIQRVREDQHTSSSRILIVAPEETETTGEESSGNQSLPLPQLPMSIGQVARSGGGNALAAAGERLVPKVESLECLIREAQRAVEELQEASIERLPVRINNYARTVSDVLSWIEATSEDIEEEVRGLTRGFQKVPVRDLFQEVPGQVESFFPGIRVNVSAAETSDCCYGNAASLTEAVFLAMVIASHRINGSGSVNAEVEVNRQETVLRIFGLGEPTEVRAPQQMSRLKDIVVEQHGGKIEPDAMGPFGAGLVLRLRREP